MLGGHLTNPREKRGLTQEASAERLGVSQKHVYRLEANKPLPTASTLKKIAHVLDADYNDLGDWHGLAEETIEKEKAIARMKSLSLEGKVAPTGNVTTKVIRATRCIPILNEVLADISEDFTDYDFPAGIAEGYVDNYLASFTTIDPSTYGLRVGRDCMAPKLKKQFIVLPSKSKQWKSGDIVAVRWRRGQGKELRRIIKQGDHLLLKPDNPEYNPIVLEKDEEPEVVGVFVMMVRLGK